MKVLHVVPRFIGGGPERHLLALSRAWRDLGVRIEQKILVLTAPASASLLIRARRLGIEMLVTPGLADIRAAMAAADVVEITFWNHPALYDLLREDLPHGRYLLRSAVAGTTTPQVLTQEIGRFADAIITSSEASMDTLAVALVRARECPVSCIPALADMGRLSGIVPIPHQGIRVGYLGLIEPTKMHPRFADLAAAVTAPGVEFDIYGDGFWEQHLRLQFASVRMSDRVRFHGYVEDIRTAFAAMDIFGYPLAPDTYATSEKVLQEAMWSGVPPVVLSTSAPSLLVQDGRTGLVCQTEEAYAAAIDRLATDAPFRLALGQAAKAFARENFDPDRNAIRFLRMFEALRAQPRREFVPLPGRSEAGAKKFVLSLGHLGQDFRVSFEGAHEGDAAALLAAEERIRDSPAVLAQGEGGIVHYRNSYPEDPHLRLWSGLVAQGTGKGEVARTEFEGAIRLGLDPSRVLPYL